MPNPTEEDLNWATADGANIIFTLIFGWVPSASYVGWWELVWRLAYRKNLSSGKFRLRLSSWIIGFSLIVGLLVASLVCIPYGYPRGVGVFFHILLPPFLDVIYR